MTNLDGNSLQTLYDESRRLYETNDYAGAEEVYKKILYKCPDDWEAQFYYAISQVKRKSVADMQIFPNLAQNFNDYNSRRAFPEAEDYLCNSLEKIIESINKISDDSISKINVNSVKEKAVATVTTEITALMGVILVRVGESYQKCLNNCSKIGGLRGDAFIREASMMYYPRIEKALNFTYHCGDLINDIISEEEIVKMYAPVLWKMAVEMDKNNKRRKGYIEMICEYDPDYEPTKIQKNGCYIATCVYGSYDCPEVWTLRRYRDEKLGATWCGRAFIRIYYTISPIAVKLFGKTKWFNKIWKGVLDNKVKRLHYQGYADTPYKDKEW